MLSEETFRERKLLTNLLFPSSFPEIHNFHNETGRRSGLVARQAARPVSNALKVFFFFPSLVFNRTK